VAEFRTLGAFVDAVKKPLIDKLRGKGIPFLIPNPDDILEERPKRP